MPNYHFTDNRGRLFEVRVSSDRDGLYLQGNRRRLDAHPLKPSVVTSLLQELVRGFKRQELLDEIEWLGHKAGTREFCCLWCDQMQSEGHAKGCRWLTARGGDR